MKAGAVACIVCEALELEALAACAAYLQLRRSEDPRGIPGGYPGRGAKILEALA